MKHNIKIELNSNEMFTLVEMLEMFCDLNAEAIDNSDDDEEIENMKSIQHDYETLTKKIIEIYNANH